MILVAATGIVIVLELLPLLMIVLLSVVQEGSWTWQVLPDQFTLDNYRSVFADAAMLEPLRNSVVMAVLACAAAVVLGVAGAYVAVRGGVRRGSGLLDLAITLPYAVPGTVVAIALIMAFDGPSPLTFGGTLVGTFWILPLAYVVRTYPLVVRSAGASLSDIDESVLEAGESLGAGAWRRFRRLIVPLALPGVVAGGVLVVISAVGEFVSSILLYAYDSRPVSVEILSQLRIFRFGPAAVYCVVVLGIILVLVWFAAGSWRGKRTAPATDAV
jgi:iron(III) transport system permease protein